MKTSVMRLFTARREKSRRVEALLTDTLPGRCFVNAPLLAKELLEDLEENRTDV